MQMKRSASIRDVLGEVKRLIARVNLVQEVLAEEGFRAERDAKQDNTPFIDHIEGKHFKEAGQVCRRGRGPVCPELVNIHVTYMRCTGTEVKCGFKLKPNI